MCRCHGNGITAMLAPMERSFSVVSIKCDVLNDRCNICLVHDSIYLYIDVLTLHVISLGHRKNAFAGKQSFDYQKRARK